MVAIVGPIISYLLLTKRIFSTLRVGSVLGLLVGFISMVSVGAVLLSIFYAKQVTPIIFSDNKVSFGSKSIPYKQIRKYYIKPVYQQSRYSSQITTDTSLLFVIEEKDKKAHVFSNEYYDLMELKVLSDLHLKKD